MANPYDFDQYYNLRQRLGKYIADQYAQNLLGDTPEEQPPAETVPNQNPFQQVKEAIQAVQPSQQPAPETEFNSKSAIDQGTIAQAAPDSDVAKAVRSGQSLQTPQSEFRYPNPVENRFLQGILLDKAFYENLPQDEQYNALREGYHKDAEALREQAATAGIDVSRLGAENSTARDLNQQVQSNRARALLESTMPDGKYSRTADQYYRDSYYDHIALGFSPRQARKFAANRAREYQADRVGYLDATYNSYGRDGYLATPEGVQLLAEIAKENPALANFYGQVYSLPKDEYSRQSKLTEEAVKNNNQIGQLMLQHGFTNENQFNQFLYNAWLKALDYLQGLGKIDATANANIKTHAGNKATDEQFDIRKENRVLEQLKAQAENAFNIASQYLSPEELELYKKYYFGILQGNGKSGSRSSGSSGGSDEGGVAVDKFSQQMTHVYNAIANEIAKLEESNLQNPSEENQNRIIELRKKLDDTYDVIQNAWGLNEPAFIFTGNMAEDEKTLDSMYLYYQRDYANFRAAVDQLMDISKLKDNERAALRQLYTKKYYPGHR